VTTPTLAILWVLLYILAAGVFLSMQLGRHIRAAWQSIWMVIILWLILQVHT
jgi:transposase